VNNPEAAIATKNVSVSMPAPNLEAINISLIKPTLYSPRKILS